MSHIFYPWVQLIANLLRFICKVTETIKGDVIERATLPFGYTRNCYFKIH